MFKKFKVLWLVIFAFSFFSVNAQMYIKKEPFAHTFSIVARDTVTGEMGVAVQSHWFSVGSIVIWGEAGVGVVATQSFVNPSFGPRGLSLLKNGLTPQMAIDDLLKLDPSKEVRQLAILDNKGNVASFTGKNCIKEAGNIVGNNYSVQANLMEKPTVWPAMSKAFENTKGTLADRMIAALEAAQKEGGDIRGKQSAALLVVNPTSTGKVWVDRKIDLRVEDSQHPIKELKRLLKVHKAYAYMNKGDLDVEKGKMKMAKKDYMMAQQLNPDNIEMKYWYAVALANNGEFKIAKPIFEKIFKNHKNWQKLIPRLVDANLLTIPSNQIKELVQL